MPDWRDLVYRCFKKPSTKSSQTYNFKPQNHNNHIINRLPTQRLNLLMESYKTTEQQKIKLMIEAVSQKIKSIVSQKLHHQIYQYFIPSDNPQNNDIKHSKIYPNYQLKFKLRQFIFKNSDQLKQFQLNLTKNIILKLQKLINSQCTAQIQLFQKKLQIQQLQKLNKQQIHQQQLNYEDFKLYLQSDIKILKTIFKNIQLDYHQSYTKENIINVMELYRKAHSKLQPSKIKQKYQKQKKKLKQQNRKDKSKYINQLKILQWFQTERGIKYDNNNPDGNAIATTKQPPKLPICSFTKDLQKGNFDEYWIQNQYQYSQILQKLFSQIKTNVRYLQNRVYKVKKQPNNKLRLTFTKNNLPKQLKTIWITEITQDGRCVWRADSQVDKVDVKHLLLFILSTRWNYSQKLFFDINSDNQFQLQAQQYQQCPSIVINTGSHGVQEGDNAYQKGDQQLFDSKIINQTKQIIHQIIQQIKLGQLNILLTQQNIHKKILISQISVERPGVYPLKANHIIDTQCHGAFNIVKAKYLTPHNFRSQLIQKDLLFLQELKPKPQLFWNSAIIKDKDAQTKILNFFQDNIQTKQNQISKDIIKVKDIKLLYRASLFQYSVIKYLQKYGTQTNTLFICTTNKDKIIGAYSPVSHLWNDKDPNQWVQYLSEQNKYWAKDQSKTSFIFTLTENQKFELQDESRAIGRSQNNLMIKFGAYELLLREQSNIQCCCTYINKILGYSSYKWSQKYSTNGVKQTVKASKLFNGNDNLHFMTKEWEVWKIQFNK